jgi:hypothetical protein
LEASHDHQLLRERAPHGGDSFQVGLIALFAHQWMRQAAGAFRRQAAWYHKRHPTFADALALVRKELWAHATFYGSPAQADTIKVPREFMEILTEAVCYAA